MNPVDKILGNKKRKGWKCEKCDQYNPIYLDKCMNCGKYNEG